MEDFSIRDIETERRIRLHQRMSVNMTSMFIAVSEDYKIMMIGDRLAYELGYRTPTHTLLGESFDMILGDGLPDNHEELVTGHIKRGGAPYWVPTVANLRHQDGSNVPCAIQAWAAEDVEQRIIVTYDEKAEVSVYGIAEILLLDRLPKWIRNALDFQDKWGERVDNWGEAIAGLENGSRTLVRNDAQAPGISSAVFEDVFDDMAVEIDVLVTEGD